MKILFVYPSMMLGGSTTSLLSILYNLDYNKYDVDLILDHNTGDWMSHIPSDVNLLTPSYKYQNTKVQLIRRLLSPKFMLTKLKAKIIEKQHNSHKLGQQYLEMKDVDFYRDIDEEYDVAIAFLEGQPCKYVANHVKAKKKIAWIHIDYKASGFNPDYDIESMKKFDSIVTVSEECLKSFRELFPELSSKCIYIDNILSKKRLLTLSKMEPANIKLNSNCINLATTCRISFSSKGLDRAVLAIAKIKNDGIVNFDRFRWYIIGGGNDYDKLQTLITENGLSENIILLGMQTNPYKFLNNMDLFFLPSRWEGKPMAVTEAQILGLPALVTNYSSAHEQVRNGIDGMVVDNSEEGVYNGIRYILENPNDIKQWAEATRNTVYENTEEIKKVENLIDG